MYMLWMADGTLMIRRPNTGFMGPTELLLVLFCMEQSQLASAADTSSL